MGKRDKKDNDLENLKENENNNCIETATEKESKYDQYEPVPCLNYGYH